MEYKKGDVTTDHSVSFLDKINYEGASGSVFLPIKDAALPAGWFIEEVFIRGVNTLTELVEGTVASWDSNYLDTEGASRWGGVLKVEYYQARGTGPASAAWIALVSVSKNAIDEYVVGTPTVIYNGVGGTTVAFNESAGVYTLDVTMDDQTSPTALGFGKIKGEIYKEIP